MTKNRIFRALICFVLICCMFVSYASIPARAFVFAEVAIPALTLVFLFLIMQNGFLPPPDVTISNLENIDQSMRNWYGDLDISFRNPDDPWPDDLDDEESDLSEQLDAIKDAINNGAEEDLEQTLKISEELMNFFKLYAAFCIGENAIPLLGEEAAEGYAYYNGVLLPILPTLEGYSYSAITVNANNIYQLFLSEMPLYSMSSGGLLTGPNSTDAGYCISYSLNGVDTSSEWTYVSEGFQNRNVWVQSGVSLVWSNYSIFDKSNSTVLYLSASTPLTQEEAYLEAVAILGETAQGIQAGTKTEDDIVIPQYVNVSELFANATSADDLMQNYNQISQELQDGTRDYNEFAQSVVATAPSTGDNVNDNTGSDSDIGDGTGTDSSDTWEPPEDPGKFALDLSEVFPFCIPFDLYALLTCLNADPVAPVIQWELALPGGGSYPFEIDLSPFEPVAQVLRRLQLLLFIVALAIKTRDLIKG